MSTDWVQIISSLGFPIVSCVALGWFVKYIIDKNTAELKAERESHAREQSETRTALDNNTSALNQLIALVQALVFREKMEGNKNEDK